MAETKKRQDGVCIHRQVGLPKSRVFYGRTKAEAERNSDITIVDNLPGTNAGYGFSDATTAPQATATPVPEATLPPTNP